MEGGALLSQGGYGCVFSPSINCSGKESSKKLNVDINKLLNRVKNDVYKEKKSKIIFFSLVTSLIGLLGVLISVVR